MCEVSSLFGYVTVYKDELLVREFNEYKAVYCGLCKSLGKEYGVLSRAILSYDCTFYALFLLALKGNCPGYEQKMCRCNPLKKCTYIKEGADSLSKAGALSVCSVYFKIIDKIFEKLQKIYDESLEKDVISLTDYIKMYRDIYDMKIKTMVNDVHRTIKTEDEYLEYSKLVTSEDVDEEELNKFILTRALEVTSSDKVKEILEESIKPKVEEITEDILDEVDTEITEDKLDEEDEKLEKKKTKTKKSKKTV